MGEIEFAVIKINGKNVEKLSKDEALQAFMNTNPFQIEIQQCKAFLDSNNSEKCSKTIVLSLRCSDLHQNTQESQTDFTVETLAYRQCNKDGKQKGLDDVAAAEADKERLIEEEHVLFDQCLAPEIDIEEVTLRKSSSNEQLGLSIIYSSGPDGSSSKTNSGGSNNGATTNSTIGSGSEYNNENCTEVFISHIQADSVAWRDGRLRQGDQILQINGKEIKTKEETETLIAENNNAVTLLVSRYLYTDEDDFNDPSLVVDLDEVVDDDEEEDENDETDNDDDGRTERGDIYTDSNLAYENCPLSKEGVNLIRNLNKNLLDHEKSQTMATNSVNTQAVAAGRSESVLVSERSMPNESKDQLATISELCRKDMQTNSKLSTEKPEKGTLVGSKVSFTAHLESDTEHIYETIPEDSEAEPFYCSPYESSTYVNAVGTCSSSTSVNNGNGEAHILQQRQKQRVAQWLGLMHSSCGQAQPALVHEHEDNNSSSAYNTGGSNASAQQQMRNDAQITVSRNILEENMPNNVSFKHFPRFRDKTNQKSTGFNTTVPILGKSVSAQTRTGCEDLSIPDTLVRMYPPLNPVNPQISNKKQTIRDSAPRAYHTGMTDQMSRTVSMLCPHFNAPNLRQYHFVSSQEVSSLNAPIADAAKAQHVVKIETSQQQKQQQQQPSMVWKVKRRPDGTRYIVRRPAAAVNAPPNDPSNSVIVGRNRIIRNPEHLRNDVTTTEDDTISEVKTGRYWSKEERKKHVERARERRQQQQQHQLQQQQQLIEAATTIRISDKMVARLQQYRKQRQKQQHSTLKVQHQDLQFGGGTEVNFKTPCERELPSSGSATVTTVKTLPQNAINKMNPLTQISQQQHQFLNHSHSPGDGGGVTTTTLIPIEDINPNENCSSP